MSVHAQAYLQYRNSTVETASPGRLLLMLYDAAIQHLEGAKKELAGNNMQGVHDHLVKAEQIVMELMSTLNMEYDIAKNLWSLYDYLYRQLVQANIRKSAELMEEVQAFLIELRDTWQEAIKRAGVTKAQAGNQVQRLSLEG